EIGERHDAAVRAVRRLVLGDPVEAREPGVEHAVRDVPRHLLRADQHALDFGIVDRREVRSRARVDGVAGARKQLHRRVLQRAFRDAESEFHIRVHPCPSVAFYSGRKHVRAPGWHTLPSPSRFTFSSTVSSSQSTSSEVTCRRLPEVSPLVQSAFRVRLKNVANPVALVPSKASSFMNPTISTSPVVSSFTTPGTHLLSFV